MSKIYSINVKNYSGDEFTYYFLGEYIKAVDELCFLSDTIKYDNMIFGNYGSCWDYDKNNKFMNHILKTHGIEDYYKPFIDTWVISIKELPENVEKDYVGYILNNREDILQSDDYLIYTYNGKVKLYDMNNGISYIVKNDK